jgi:GNAT superfamily N-acetyltransferase
MHPSVVLTTLKSNDWLLYRQLRLTALAESPNAFGSTLELEQSRTPAEWSGRLSAAETSNGDLPLVALVEGAASGLAWAKRDSQSPLVVNLFQMWVAPERRGAGVGAALLRESITWAKGLGAEAMHLGVAHGESPALRLYIRAGFLPFGSSEPLRPGSALLSQNMRLVLRESVV